MLPYYVMLLIIIFCALKEDNLVSVQNKKKLFRIALIPVFVLIAFKANTVGTDTISYYRSYESARDFGMSSLDDFAYDRVEPGYKLLIYVLTVVKADAQFLSIIVACLIVYTLNKIIRENSVNWSLALFFFVTMGFFQFAMSGIRQTIAICFTLLSYSFIKERRLFMFLLLIFIGATFHKSVVVFIPAYFIANQDITKKKVAMMFSAMLVLLFTADKLLLSVADIMDYNYGIEETGNGHIFLGVVLLITLLVVHNRNLLIKTNPNNKIVININFISLALWVVRLISRTAERVSLYFMPYTYLVLEEYLSTRPVSQKRIYIMIAILMTSLLCIRRLLGQEDLCDYKFFFQ